MSLPTDLTGLPILPREDGIGLLFSDPKGQETPWMPYSTARMIAGYYASKHPEMRGEVVEYVKLINRTYLKHLLRRRVQKKLGHEAWLKHEPWFMENMPRADRKLWERAAPRNGTYSTDYLRAMEQIGRRPGFKKAIEGFTKP